MLKDFYNVDTNLAKIKIKANFHTHNYLCGHAGGMVCDYVKEGIAHGLEIIGISDHCAPPVGTYEPYFTIDNMDELYLSQFEEAKKYADKIKIYAGAEIEFFDGHDAFYKRLRGELDYLVLGQHEYMLGNMRQNSFCDGIDDKNIIAYFDNVKRGLRSGYFALLAHPDLIFYRSPQITDKVIAAFDDTVRVAKECGVTVELNANGIRSHRFRYPTDLLITLCKKHNAKVAVSSDCHSPDALCDEYMLSLYDYAARQKLNLVDNILQK